MQITQPSVASINYYDRGPLPVGAGLNYNLTSGTSPPNSTLYTVPAGRKCYINSVCISMNIVTATGSTNDNSSLSVSVQTGGVSNASMGVSMEGLPVGSHKVAVGMQGVIMNEGDTLVVIPEVPGTLGVFRTLTQFAGTEYNA